MSRGFPWREGVGDSLSSHQEGEDQVAFVWQVERVSGALLGRVVLG